MPPFVVTQEWSRPKPVQNEPRPIGVIDLIYSQLLNEQPPACSLNCKRQWQYARTQISVRTPVKTTVLTPRSRSRISKSVPEKAE